VATNCQREKRGRMMLTIEIVNDGTGDEVVGNYNYKVFINKEKIDSGRIEWHNRLSGWRGLISCLAEVVFPDEEN
jgi:hypothetical protein